MTRTRLLENEIKVSHSLRDIWLDLVLDMELMIPIYTLTD
jgi:hypothetical protein